LRRKNPRLFTAFDETPEHVCPPNGETLAGVMERTAKSLKPLLKRHAGDTILLVAPDPLRLLIRSWLRKADVPNPWDDDGPAWEAVEIQPDAPALAEAPPGAAR
jgi:broad specificity phosphatase PhoE